MVSITVDIAAPPSAIDPQVPVEVLYVPDQYNIIIDFAHSTGPVVGGGVSLSETDSDQNHPSIPAKIKINNPDNPNSGYNAYAFGNGLESDRIRDDYNETTLKWSPRATNVVEDYGQEVKSSSLCYSGIYKEETSLNALNEFNLSKANFKNLDAEFGSIQKLYARDTDLVVFQENKVSRVLYGKNLLSDAVGGGQVSSIPEVLGTQVSIRGEYGISNNPESFAEWGDIMYWTDERRGSVLMSEGSQIVDISNTGMKDYFRDLFRDDPNTQHWGAFDPYRSQYIIASNDDDATPCTLNIKPTSGYYPGKPSGLNKVNLSPDFDVVSNTSWTMSIAYSAGTGWVTGFPASGFGNQSIYLGVADNLTGAIRTATITITYCGGKTETYDITQGAGNKVEVRPIVLSNFNSNSLF
jgi:hypothetical protein